MSGMYLKAKEKMWTAGLDVTGDVKAIGINSSTYTVDYANDEFLSDLVCTVTSGVSLANVTYANGKLTADAVNLGTPSSTCNAVVIYISTGVAATSPLICYLDDSVGLPSEPADGDIPVTWDSDLGIASI